MAVTETEPLTLGLLSGVIDPRERDRILCDSTVVPVTTDHRGEILNVGRATPVWNRAMRRAMTTRSPHCQGPGCSTPAPWCDAHHFQHWEHSGETSSRTVSTSVEDTTSSSTNTATGTTRSTINTSACTEPTAPKSTPTPGTTSRHDAVRRGRRGVDAVGTSVPYRGAS